MLIVSRGLYPGDVRRHFVGIVTDVSEVAVRVRGWVFLHDEQTTHFVRRPEEREAIFSLAHTATLIYVLPQDAALQDITYDRIGYEDKRCHRFLSDGRDFGWEVSEFGP